MAKLNLSMSDHSMKLLEHLKDVTKSESYAEVFRNALRLYQALIEEAQAGNEFLIRRSDGSLKSYAIFFASDLNSGSNKVE